MKQIAVITGASSGFGRELARLLVHKRQVEEIWALARSPEKLRLLAEELGGKIRPMPLDVSSAGDLHRLEARLAEEQPRILYLVNSAGFGRFCSTEEMTLEETLNMVDVNCAGLAGVTKLCLPWLHEGSRVLNVASQASFQPLPYLNVYSATKAFARNYSRALNVELRPRGITVTAVCPGWMKTAFFDRAKTDSDRAPRVFWGMAEPRRVALRALLDAEHGRDISVYSPYVQLCHVTAKVLPQRAMMGLWMWQQKF